MMNGAVSREQRHTKARRCPICDGADTDPRGKSKRCFGFTSVDGEYVHCSREDRAGNLTSNDAELYTHRMHGDCRCGVQHGPDRATSKIEATYDYRDGRGELLFQVVRFVGKEFRQRRPDGAGGWTWRLADTRRVLYRLPALLEDDADRAVHVVEGEKDVETLERRGYLATCNPGGAGKWRQVAEHAREVLRGREVIVIADADDVGRKHARDVADSLRTVVRSLVTLTPPAPHKDTTDLLAAGRALTDLVSLPATSEEAPATEQPKVASLWSRRIVSVGQSWLAEAPPAREYLFVDRRTGKGAVPAIGAALLASAGGVGKSYAIVACAIAIATGTPWLGELQPTHAGRVLIVSPEEPADELHRRIYYVARDLGIETLPDGAIEVIDVHDQYVPLLSPDGRPTEHAATLIALARERGPYSAVMLDPIGRIAGASIDKDNVAAGALIAVMEGIGSAAQGLTLGAHHTSLDARRKKITDATALRGATGLGDYARLVLLMGAEQVDVGDTPQWADLGEIVTLRRVKANHVPMWDPIQLRRGEHGVLVPLTGGDREIVVRSQRAAAPAARRRADREEQDRARTTVIAQAIVAVLAKHPEGLSYRALRAEVANSVGGVGDKVLDRGLSELGATVVKRPGPRGADIHALAGDGGAS